MPVIEVDNLSKIFGKRSKEALSLLDEGLSKDEILKKTGCTVGVNRAKFQVEAGEVFVIMGLSGSGKSTLVRLLNRLINPTAGDVYVHDDNLSTMNKEELRRVRREKMSMVFQKFGLFPFRTVLENTVFGMEVQGMDKDERKESNRST